MKLQDIFTDESKWIKNVSARDAEGEVVFAREPTAVCFCLLGGICKITQPGQEWFDKVRQVVNHVEEYMKENNLVPEDNPYYEKPVRDAITIGNFNDHSTTDFATVQKFLKKYDL